MGIRVTAKLPAGDLIGPYEALTLVFLNPTDQSLAIEIFFISQMSKGNSNG